MDLSPYLEHPPALPEALPLPSKKGAKGATKAQGTAADKKKAMAAGKKKAAAAAAATTDPSTAPEPESAVRQREATALLSPVDKKLVLEKAAKKR
jgi:hypothetical protein